jgi:diamine N-acetyltransferase
VDGSADLRLSEAVADDLPYVHAMERRSGYEHLTAQWSLDQHRRELARTDTRYFVAVDAAMQRLGFVILQPTFDPHEGTKVKRIVVAEPGRGDGRKILACVFDWVFSHPGADRVWLDVFSHNERARRLYRGIGMREDGTLRKAYKMADGSRVDRIIMSLLRDEWRACAG